MLWRSWRQNVYHLCQRCNTRQPFSRMIWQNGLLVCSTNKCIDKAIVGTRDINVARAVAVDRHELRPDDKLTAPTARQNDQLEVLY